MGDDLCCSRIIISNPKDISGISYHGFFEPGLYVLTSLSPISQKTSKIYNTDHLHESASIHPSLSVGFCCLLRRAACRQRKANCVDILTNYLLTKPSGSSTYAFRSTVHKMADLIDLDLLQALANGDDASAASATIPHVYLYKGSSAPVMSLASALTNPSN